MQVECFKNMANGWVTRKNLPKNSWESWIFKDLIIVFWWACVRLDSWCGKSIPSRWSFTGLSGWPVTLGLRYGQTLFGGSSEESWTLSASLIQLFRVGDEGYIDRKALSWRCQDNVLTSRRSSGKFCASSRGKTGGASVIQNYWA